ncbi:MAG: LON peptidase substrate-binding domain-containing protein [Rubinisphaera brasiliensis]|uniref:Peptidase S16 lon domain protein n=1 Tax=Rubinisphaera brasiliensis (strain ATCC 49424 / DSM 5305 / JCM 21570 / IAM 15109 / NBRC 103401 / IFAM 1448) TaxID=756272 RepID=F0SGY8_RUBBR|nr:LON peptidase substrate-binding domain-containing protein [Rubinisphaera brasiliensis]ADY59473.1 peptidase S16 lon domain protein [Rubinisphaera brasiliensis DSM 5305]MBR9803500.1 LON peptidase substrate-binding domain-containing protein [bacterium]
MASILIDGDFMLVEHLSLPDDFAGAVRLFPLPEVVLFPRMILPLHIFEPRYCAMLDEALETDGLITMATLQKHPEDPEHIAQEVCIGRIIGHEPTDHGTHNIILAGVERARIQAESQHEKVFRCADVDLVTELESEDILRQQALSERLIEGFVGGSKGIQKIRNLVQANAIGLAAVTDLVAYYSQLNTSQKLVLLGERDPFLRARYLFDYTDQTTRPFPPPFSMN